MAGIRRKKVCNMCGLEVGTVSAVIGETNHQCGNIIPLDFTVVEFLQNKLSEQGDLLHVFAFVDPYPCPHCEGLVGEIAILCKYTEGREIKSIDIKF